MDFRLSKEQEMLRQMYRDFCQNEVKPIAAEIDENERFPWETVGKIGGVKVLEPMSGGHKLPEEAHSSRMYILQHPQNGNFAQLRIYDKWHRLRFEVGYHREPTLDKSGRPVLHYHVYTYPSGSSVFNRTDARTATMKMWKKLGKYMKGVVSP